MDWNVLSRLTYWEKIAWRQVKQHLSIKILTLLSDISLGNYYFNIGLLLRETNIISGVLSGSEAWYGVTKQEVQMLESADLHYIRKLFGAHSSTAKEAFYLETGKLPT